MTVKTNSLHPFIKEPILYVIDSPARLRWEHLKATFRSYGAITLISKNESPGDEPRQTWAIRLSTIYYAEMALATLHGHPVESLDPSWALALSPSATMKDDTVHDRSFPQYLKIEPGSHLGDAFNSRLVFRCFRSAGPLASVRVGVEVGEQHPTIVLQYFEEENARFARSKANTLHRRLRQCAKFTLVTFDPCSLHCSGFGPDYALKDLVDAFSVSSNISGAILEKVGEPGLHGIVTFRSPADAAHALQEMNGRVLETGRLSVRYAEPTARHVLYLPAPPDKDPGHASESSDTGADNPDVSSADTLPERADTPDTRANELLEMRLRRDDLERLLTQTKQDLEAARADDQDANREYDLARKAQKSADTEVEAARQACAEAERIWLEAKEREATAVRQASRVQDDANAALSKKRKTALRIKAVEEEESTAKAEKMKLDRELAEDDELRHQAELEDSIKRAREMRELEEEERREKERRKQEAEAEMQRRLREEAERLARERQEAERQKRAAKEHKLKLEREAAERAAREEREKKQREKKAEEERQRLLREHALRIARELREKEEMKRLAAETRERLYQEALRKEQERCRERDDVRFCPRARVVIWDEWGALSRFMFISSEFDRLKFSDSRPLTFGSVPWPLLGHPEGVTFDTITRVAVEKFFKSMGKVLGKHSDEYVALVERARLQFHPDRWRARRILDSVWDKELRSKLEAAGNVVSQAVNPLRSKRQ